MGGTSLRAQSVGRPGRALYEQGSPTQFALRDVPPTAPGTRRRLRLFAVALEPAVKRAAIDTELFRGPGLVAAGLVFQIWLHIEPDSILTT